MDTSATDSTDLPSQLATPKFANGTSRETWAFESSLNAACPEKRRTMGLQLMIKIHINIW
jgi:hypothetical protein